MFFFTILCISFFFSLSLAFPLRTASLSARDVFSPPITNPNASTVWNVGETHTVTWDTSSLPSNLTNTGMILLGFLENDSENLDLDNPLAQGFLLTTGHADITVPNVPTKEDYIVVLFGDSGNISPEFTIIGSSVSSSVTVTASSTSLSATAHSSSARESSTPASTISMTIIASVSSAVTTQTTLTVTPSPPIATATLSSFTSVASTTDTAAASSSTPTAPSSSSGVSALSSSLSSALSSSSSSASSSSTVSSAALSQTSTSAARKMFNHNTISSLGLGMTSLLLLTSLL